MGMSDDSTTPPTPESIAGYVKRNAAKARKTLAAMHDHGPTETVRETDYKGHHIVIGTTYRVEVDGQPVSGHFIVTDNGEVQCHAMPNYTFISAVDLVKSMIDIFPEDFAGSGGRDHGRHADTPDPHMGDHGAHGGSSPPRKTGKSAKKSALKPKTPARNRKGGRRGRH